MMGAGNVISTWSAARISVLPMMRGKSGPENSAWKCLNPTHGLPEYPRNGR